MSYIAVPVYIDGTYISSNLVAVGVDKPEDAKRFADGFLAQVNKWVAENPGTPIPFKTADPEVLSS